MPSDTRLKGKIETHSWLFPDVEVRIKYVRIGKEDYAMRITSKGQVTIPISMREKLGFLPNSEVEFEIEGESLRLRKVDTGQGRGSRLVSQLRGKATTGMSTEEIMALTRGG